MEHKYINREISWLQFNERVISESLNVNNPILERFRFLAIAQSNINEFCTVRIAKLYNSTDKNLNINGLTALEQLKIILPRLSNVQHKIEAGFERLISEAQQHNINIVTDIMVEDIITELRFVDITSQLNTHNYKHAVIYNGQIASVANLDKFYCVDNKIITLEDALRGQGDYKFIRILHDYDIGLSSYILEDVAEAEDILKQRKTSKPVVILGDGAALMQHFHLTRVNLINYKYPFAIENIGELLKYDFADKSQMLYPELAIRFPERIDDYEGDYFAAIKAKDILVHHPYESFDVVVEFVKFAANDEHTTHIKQTLYRTTDNSEIVQALIKAAKNGKQVTCVIEIKARFDEKNNIELVNILRQAGAKVIYQIENLKTHAKASYVRRDIDGRIEQYAHFGTGNYHPINARIYTDLSLLTDDNDLCSDVSKFFDYAEGKNDKPEYSKIIVAPNSLRKFLLDKINEEKLHSLNGRPANIWIKINALVDKEIIDALYEASSAGVKITLIVRGICSLRAGVQGLSENIVVKSIVGRFLEHSRIYCFGGGNHMPSSHNQIYISSADLMSRNMDKRIEIAVPITNETIYEQILGQVMQSNIDDNMQSYYLQDSEYIKSVAGDYSTHQFFIDNPSLSGRGKALYGDIGNIVSPVIARNIAMIDIGSNSVRLVIYDGIKRVPITLLNEKQICELALDMDRTGKLNVKGKKQAIEALARYSRIIDAMAVEDIHCFATSAVRDAADGNAFIKRIKRLYNLDVQIISGVDEAYYSALGVLSAGFTDNGVVADLGGGSMDIAHLNQGNISHQTTLPLGVVRFKGDDAELQEALNSSPIANNKYNVFYAVGGSFRTLLKIHFKYIAYPLSILHFYKVSSDDIIATCDNILANPDKILALKGDFVKERLQQMPYTARLLKQIIAIGGFDTIYFSNYGVREGLLYNLLNDNQKASSALFAGSVDLVRQTTISHQFDNRIGFSFELSNWIKRLLPDIETNLMGAACILSWIGWHEVREYRAETAYRVVVNSALSAVTHKNRVFIAACVFFRYSKPVGSDTQKMLKKMLGLESYNLAKSLGRIIRLGHKISGGGVMGILPRITIQHSKDITILMHATDRCLINDDILKLADKISGNIGKKISII